MPLRILLMAMGALVLTLIGAGFDLGQAQDVPAATALAEQTRFVPGASDAAVVVLRKMLIDLGYLARDQALGQRYDKFVIAAARRFQLAQALRNTGIAGGQTIPRLNQTYEAWRAGKAPPPPKSEPAPVRGGSPASDPAIAVQQNDPAAQSGAALPRCAPPHSSSTKPAAPPALPLFDAGMTARLAEARSLYAAIVERGGWPMLPRDLDLHYGQTGDAVALLRRRLAAEGYVSPSADLSGSCYDSSLDQALRAFQAAHGLPERDHLTSHTLQALNVDARRRLAAIDASLLRAGQKKFAGFQMSGRYAILNIASAHAQIIENGKVLVTQRVAVGKFTRQSPEIVARITGIRFAPSWRVPFRIAREEIAPKFAKDPDYLKRRRLRVEDPKGNPIDPHSVRWAGSAYLLREEPGPHSSLGPLLVEMPNEKSVFMHGTSNRFTFGRLIRTASHGCARLSDPVSFAAAILQPTYPMWTRDAVLNETNLMREAWDAEHRVELPKDRTVPVAWLYLTAWTSQDGVTHFADDVYRRDGSVATVFQ